MIFALIVYNFLLLLLSPVAVIYIICGLIISDKSRHGMSERLGFISSRKINLSKPCIWLHAVSVGETVAAKPIWEELLAALPGWSLYHSTTTDTGQIQAVKAAGDRARIIYFPFDFLPCVWLALRKVRPELIVMVETELWPNFLAVSKLLGCKVMVVNGRISDRSLSGASHLPWLYRWMTGNIDRFCMQSEEDQARIIRLGADPARVCVVGNSKFDQAVSRVSLGEQVKLRDALGLKRDEPMVIAGSTHPGEEEIVLRAFRQLKKMKPNVRLIIAPRDIHRSQKVEELVVAHGFAVTRRTKIATVPPPPDAIIILDTIGELSRAYALCTSAFVGGSLVNIGGHNVLEALGLGKPVIFGPNMTNFRDIASIVIEEEVGFQVSSAEKLAEYWLKFFTDSKLTREIAKKNKRIFQQHAGASQRCAEEAAQLVPGEQFPAIIRQTAMNSDGTT